MIKKNEYDKTHLKYGHSTAIADNDVVEYLKNYKPDISSVLQSPNNDEFAKTFVNWIMKSNNNITDGFEVFKHGVYSNGTTEAFEKFYWNNQDKRLRFFKGEYLYHKIAWRGRNWKFLDNGDLDRNDAVIISLPFADTGSKHINMDYVLNSCDKLDIPVLIDGCYFGISSGMEYNFKHKCITDITFSLSKVFPATHARIGIRFTKHDTDDLLFVAHKHLYTNRLGADLGIKLMNTFSADYIFDKYRNKQLNICRQLNVQPSDTVLFGIGGDTWHEYNRGGTTNRLSFHKFLV